MKNKILISFISLSILSLFASCEYNVKNYEGEAGIYFESVGSDTVGFSWIYYDSDIEFDTLKLRVMTMGKQANYDRPFSIEFVAEKEEAKQAMEGVDYEAFSMDYMMPANESFLDVEIILLRNPSLLATGDSRLLTVKLKSNEHFKFLFNRVSNEQIITEEEDTIKWTRYIDLYRTIKIREVMTRQVWWSPGEWDFGNYGYDLFGKWSAKKSLMICDSLNLDRKDWLEGATESGRDRVRARRMQKILDDAMDAGNMIFDEDGQPMMMGDDAQL